ncbi:glycoside hydrolase family 36 protein [Butyrivibrio proteoclasticus]|uniref:glycoside hydrolase family 36 protein n=1 Tax=Butyrivibrio proteoclasticus TaxID=43305 RepID=UPI0004794C2F|nr:glycoside hydrolase family 36 protein [Butyrivibrio proteoclasticus]
MKGISGSVKIIGDEYAAGYCCGLSMVDNGTARRFKTMMDEEDMTILETEDGLTLNVSHTKSETSDATIVETTFINDSEKDVTLEYMTSFMLEGVEADKIYRMLSFWSAEGKLKVDSIYDLNMEKSWAGHGCRIEKFGNVGSMPVRKYFPFLALENSKTGKFTGIMLYAPNSWQIELVVRKEKTLTVAGGIADRDFGHWTKNIEGGSSFTAPRAIVAEGDSLLDVCDKLVKATEINPSPVDDHMGITFNEYCTTWGNPTIGNLKKIADKLEGKGIQYLVMDSGWYLEGDSQWWENRGDWIINTDRFPNGLKELSDYVREKGMIPGIWFEPEVVSFKAHNYEEQKEHVLHRDGVPITVEGCRFWDMEDPWVKDFLKEKVIDTLKDNGFGYIKVDYNDTVGIGCDGDESYGENLRNKLAGTLEFFNRMREEIPELVIENCSSGGHRLEGTFMEHATMASFSDAHETKSLPIIAANLQRVVRPEQNQIWSVMRKEDSDDRIFYSMCATFLGRMGLSGDIYDLSDHQWNLIDEGISFYNKVSHIIKDGKTTVLEADTKSYAEPTGGQLVVRTLGDESLVIYHRFENSVSMEEFARVNNLQIPEGVVDIKYGAADRDFSAMAMIIK